MYKIRISQRSMKILGIKGRKFLSVCSFAMQTQPTKQTSQLNSISLLPQDKRINIFIKARIEIYNKKVQEEMKLDKLSIDEENMETSKKSQLNESTTSLETNFGDSQEMSDGSETGDEEFFTPKKCSISPIAGPTKKIYETPSPSENKRPKTDEEMTNAPVRSSFGSTGNPSVRRQLLLKSLTEEEQELLDTCPERLILI